MRWLRYVLIMHSCFVCAQTALALDPLLVEFGWSQPNSVTLPATYTAIVSFEPWGATNLDTISQYPTIQFAASNSIAVWNNKCASGIFCAVGFSNGGQQPAQLLAQHNLDRILGGPNELWADGWDGNTQPFTNHTGTWHAATYVPQKGDGHQALFGYQITAVEREVTATTQTIRLYGVDAPIPEPSTLLLAILACCFCHISRRHRV